MTEKSEPSPEKHTTPGSSAAR